MLKKHAQIYLLALFSVFMVSCRGQNQTDLPKDSVNKQQNNLTIQGLHSISSKSIVAPFAPSSITRNIIQDKKGNTWLATWNGNLNFYSPPQSEQISWSEMGGGGREGLRLAHH